ncbi:unnamed protein product, partial [Ectocarpus fasciculatus]
PPPAATAAATPGPFPFLLLVGDVANSPPVSTASALAAETPTGDDGAPFTAAAAAAAAAAAETIGAGPEATGGGRAVDWAPDRRPPPEHPPRPPKPLALSSSPFWGSRAGGLGSPPARLTFLFFPGPFSLSPSSFRGSHASGLSASARLTFLFRVGVGGPPSSAAAGAAAAFFPSPAAAAVTTGSAFPFPLPFPPAEAAAAAAAAAAVSLPWSRPLVPFPL